MGEYDYEALSDAMMEDITYRLTKGGYVTRDDRNTDEANPNVKAWLDAFYDRIRDEHEDREDATMSGYATHNEAMTVLKATVDKLAKSHKHFFMNRVANDLINSRGYGYGYDIEPSYEALIESLGKHRRKSASE